MPKAKKKGRHFRNADFRHRANFPAPAVEEIEESLMKALTPAVFAPMRMGDGKKKLRERILTLPVMTAIVVILVWRQLPSLSEALRMLAKEGMLWINGLEVSKQALSKRLETIPASLFGQVFNEAISVIRNNRCREEIPAELKHFSAVWISDGSTMEALKKKLDKLKGEKTPLGGKIMMVVEALTHLPVTTFYSEKSEANDKRFCERLLEMLPAAGLLIFDLGFFSFPFFDAFTEAKKFFLTRLREKTSYQVVKVLSYGARYRDEIIDMGLYRSNPCKHQLRLVSILWDQTWHYYLTNVLDPEALSGRQVCELYRRRWRIEDAFLLTKRLLGLSYLWVGSTNGVEIQIYATWIFYAVLIDLCHQVAEVLQLPLERISVEMVFRSLYHFSRAVQRGQKVELVSFLVENAKLFGIVKAIRKRHREAIVLNNLVWGMA
jgi:hypothetical protein